ncbi:14613_t:CDS:2, partial [Dentiscutata heterogama]
SSASTLCTNITQSVSHVAFGNYLSFSAGLFLTCFSKPSADDKSFFAKVKRFFSDEDSVAFVDDVIERLPYILVISLISVYIIQLIVQTYFKDHVPSTGYILWFQWISLLSPLLTIPIHIILSYISSEDDEHAATYSLIYPVLFQIYLHVGYISFYLYCDEGYLSSGLLFLSGFVLNNVIRMAYEWVFPSSVWKVVKVPRFGKKEKESDTVPMI